MTRNITRRVHPMAPFALPIAMTLGASIAQAQQAPPSYADMRTWKLEGVPGGNWVDPANTSQPFASATSGRSVFQTVNNSAGTMFLVSNDTNVINRAVWGTLRIESRHTDALGACTPSCSTNENDDDYLGFVMGYENVSGNTAFPEKYIGFTWNQGGFSPYAMPGGEGIWLVNTSPPNAQGDPAGTGTTILDSETGAGTGWAYDTDYQFRILYTTNLIRVYINDVLKLEATAAQAGVSSFTAGQFGFTNASQANVLFGNVREAAGSAVDSAPVASDDKFYYGLTWGATQDNTNVFDTNTDPRAEGILDNDYDPDGDPFTLRVNGTLLPNDTDTTSIIGTQGGTFEVWGNGRIRYTAPPDYQSRGPFQDTFAYTIVDEDGERSATVTLTVQQTNTRPDSITLTDSDTSSTIDIRVKQHSAPNTVVGTIATVESNPGELDEYDYELVDASDGAFAIIGNQLVVRDTAALGGPGTHSIEIRTTDVEGQTTVAPQTFTITVDPNALPTGGNASVDAEAAFIRVLSLADFSHNFNDADGDTLQRVLITSVPNGTLFLDLDNDDVADANEIIQINFNDVVTTSQLTGGRLKYLSAATADTTTSIGFKVSDGTAYSSTAYTVSLSVDADRDNDGVPNTIEGVGDDDDGDGTPNEEDTDSDGDGLSDSVEGGGDNDADGIPNFLDNDSDNDGLLDSVEGGGDLDGDGLPDFKDTDRDGDGVPDATETTQGTNPSDVGEYRDTDHDGVPDFTEGTHGTDPNDARSFRDTDTDGVPDYVETQEGTNPNVGTDFADDDGDGSPDYRDRDSDNDGVPDIIEGTSDSDGDGTPDSKDRDSDNDGVPDSLESGAYGVDSDNDGIDDRWDASAPGSVDANHDGIVDDVGLLDSDGDGIADMREKDSDGDGVSDGAEAGASDHDSDGDGIDDAFDVDIVGGDDTNHDGIPDDVRLLDSDGDGVPDMLDLDSDNDSITDVIEGGGVDEDADGFQDEDQTLITLPVDTDGDGIPDMRDLESRGDGTKDITRTRFAALDADHDGKIDNVGDDADGDGLPDAIDGEPGQRGSRIDNDEDGIPASIDQDDDGDGILDSQEGNDDRDGDGVIDRLDRDSDNDGIPDRVEMGLGRPSGVDANANGIDDAFESVNARRDDDNDGIPDYLDDDSDNDGIPDAVEMLRVALAGADRDGDGIDDAIDVDVTGGKDTNGDGVDDAMVNLVDTDGDGIEDYRDSDSDNDGVPDGKENGDFNNDGINDKLQKDPGLKTGLNGGGGNFGVFGVLGLLGVMLTRRRRMRAVPAVGGAVLAAVAMAASVSPARAADSADATCRTGSGFSEGCWNVGFGVFKTHLAPDDSRSVWRLVDDSDVGFKLSAQYRFYDRWFLELGYADMGNATVVSRNPAFTNREPVDYRVPSLLGGYLFLDPASRFNAYVKAGYAALLTDAANDVINKQQHSNQLALGAGARLNVWEQLSAEIEYEYYDKDSRQLGLGVRYSF